MGRRRSATRGRNISCVYRFVRSTSYSRVGPFMGPLTCGRCQCAMTAEMKKGRYVYYRCTGSKGRRGNAYIRQEELSALLCATVDAIQIPEEIAEFLAEQLRRRSRPRRPSAARPRSGSRSRTARSSRSSIAATTTTLSAGSRRTSGQENRSVRAGKRKRELAERVGFEPFSNPHDVACSNHGIAAAS